MTAQTRDALVSTAGEVFAARGITATGVDAVVRAAGVSKPTLYAHFSSKAELVTAVLAERWRARQVELDTWLVEPGRQLGPLAVLDWLGEWYAQEERRGCGFLNAAAELTAPADGPARSVVREEKRWLRAVVARLAAEQGLAGADVLASQVLLLVDGVAARVLVEGPGAASSVLDDARAAGRALVEAAGRAS